MSLSRIVSFGDSCVSAQFAAAIDPAVNARCIALAAALERLALRGVRDVVPTYNAVTVHFDPLTTDRQALGAALSRLSASTAATADTDVRTIEIPVSYGGASGPDLAAVAEFGKSSEAGVVRLLRSLRIGLYMLGFLPGFAYLWER